MKPSSREFPENKGSLKFDFQSIKDWENIINSLSDMITIHDKNFNILYANRAAIENLDLDQLEGTMVKCFKYYHDADRPPDGCPGCQCLKTGTAATLELFESHLNRYLEVWVMPRVDKNDKLTGFTHIVRDITKRKKAEESLEESQENLRTVVENMPIMLDAFDSEGNIVAWNRECERVVGFNEDEMIGNPDAMKLLYPDDTYRELMMKEWEARGNDYYDWEWDITCKDGSKKTVAWYNISKRYPIPGWATWGIGVDITKRKKAYETVRLYEDVVRNMNVGLYVYHLEDIDDDRSLRMIVANPAATNFTGVKMEDIMGKNLDENFPGLRRMGIPQIYAEVVRSMKPVELGDVCYGDERVNEGWYSVRAFPLPNNCVGVSFDNITGRKQAEAALWESEKKLKIHAIELEEGNIALKVLLKQRQNDKIELEENILSNVKHLVMPYIKKLKRNRNLTDDVAYLNVLESNLNEIISPFSVKLSSKYLGLTPKEIQIADLIKDGKQDKDIMEILNVSQTTVKTHRQNIRKKLGIYSKRVNLKTHLLSLTK